MGDLVTPLVTVLMGIIGVAIVATLVSSNSNTSNVISAGGNAFSGALGTALSPLGMNYNNYTLTR